MAVTAIITGMSPVTAKAEGSNYTLISLGEERWYDDVFSGYDDSMGHWKTYHFTVQDDYGNEYEAICVEPHKDTPRESETFTATKEYGTDDIEARVIFCILSYPSALRNPIVKLSFQSNRYCQARN